MRQEDTEHLRLLSIFHFVLAGITALFACFPVIHLVFGFLMFTGALPVRDPNGAQIARIVGAFFIVGAVLVIASLLVLAALVALAGSFLRKRRHHTFCLVVAALACMFMPFGTVLGVFTILVLIRPSVKEAFDQKSATRD
jgi:hypothetical protein